MLNVTVLENLKNRANIRSEDPMSRVGASKVSCSLCAIYYALQGSTFSTNGSRSQFPPTWQCPSDDPEIRKEMCIRLRQELLNRARLFETQTLQRQPRRIGPNSKPKAKKGWTFAIDSDAVSLFILLRMELKRSISEKSGTPREN